MYADLSRQELADHLEVSERTQINTELGKRHIPRPELLAIAEACDVPMWFLEGGWEGWREAGDVGDIQRLGEKAKAQLDRAGERRRAS